MVDKTKAELVLKEATSLFETILDAEDKSDGATIEGMLKTFEDDSAPIVQWLLSKLFDASA